AVGRSRPPSRCSRVDLPQPLGPITASVRPAATSRSTPSTARTSPPSLPYCLHSPRARNTHVSSMPLMIDPSLQRCRQNIAVRQGGEPSSVVVAHIRLFCRVGGVAKAPVMVVVQPVIKHERRGRGGWPGPPAGLWHGTRS